MKVFIIESIGRKSDLLFQTMSDTFQFVDDVRDSNIIFYDIWCGFGEYNRKDIDLAIITNNPIFVFDFHDYNDYVEWPGFGKWEHLQHEQWANILRSFKDLQRIRGYFMRKMSKRLDYPWWVYPIDCCLYPDHDFPITTADELYSRPNDIFFVGNISNEREMVCNELSKHFKCDFVLGQERIPHDEWLNRARQSKMFLTADGGGWSDERAFQLITLAPMLKQKNNMVEYVELIDGKECWKIQPNVPPTDIEDLKILLNDKEFLYEIYLNGVDKMKKYYSQEARSKYILDKIKQLL